MGLWGCHHRVLLMAMSHSSLGRITKHNACILVHMEEDDAHNHIHTSFSLIYCLSDLSIEVSLSACQRLVYNSIHVV